MKISIISNVKNASEQYKRYLEDYVNGLEQEGNIVHLPHRDTNQNGSSIEICTTNIEKIREADRVDIFWSGTSNGAHFDLGAAFALKKKIKVVDTIGNTEGKSFQNLLSEWAW